MRRTRRLVLPALLLAVLVGSTVGFVVGDRAANRDSAQVLLAANRLERLVVDLETGQLGYVATGKEDSLSPWHAARAAFPAQAAVLLRLAERGGPDQARRAREIVRLAGAYIREHAEPLVRLARHSRVTARSLLARKEGRRRIDALRRQFDRFTDVQHRMALADERDAAPAARRVVAAAAGTSGSLLLLLLLVGYVVRGRGPFRPAWPARGRVHHEPEAIQRVATLVARGAPPAEVIEAAAADLGRLLHAEHIMITHFEPGGTAAVTGHWTAAHAPPIMPPGDGRWPVEDETVTDMVHRTGRPARMRADLPAVGAIGVWLRRQGITQLVGCPIVAGDRLWGMAAALSRDPRPWPPATEETMRQFTTLIGAAIAHARHASELAASRIRLIEAADAARHRIERVLHENTQQRLATVGLSLRAAEATVPAGMEELRQRVSHAAHDVQEIIEGLQDVARALHPAFLARGGLESALRALARRAALPVRLTVRGDHRPPPTVAVTAYHVTAEALANAAEHAHASAVRIALNLDEPLRLTIHDDGTGGARPRHGSALACLRDRAEALGGTLRIESPPGAGTTLRLTLPTRPGDLPPPP
jgi:signal transduction histidine kinase